MTAHCTLSAGSWAVHCSACEVDVVMATPFAAFVVVGLVFDDAATAPPSVEAAVLSCDFEQLAEVVRFPHFFAGGVLLPSVRAPGTSSVSFLVHGVPLRRARRAAAADAEAPVLVELRFHSHCKAPSAEAPSYGLSLALHLWCPEARRVAVRFCEPPPPPSAPQCRWRLAVTCAAVAPTVAAVALNAPRSADGPVAQNAFAEMGHPLQMLLWPDPYGAAAPGRFGSEATSRIRRAAPAVMMLLFAVMWAVWSRL